MRFLPHWVAALPLAVLVACEGQVSDRVFAAMIPEPSSFDPVRSNKATENTLLALIHESLVHLDADRSELVGGLASRWHSDDGSVWVFELVAGARAPDGAELTSEDVVFSMGLYGREDLNSPKRPNLLVGDELVRVRADGPSRVVIECARPAPFLPWSLVDLVILEKDRFQQFSGSLDSWTTAMWKTARKELLQGYGPFYVDLRNAQRIELLPNPGFYRWRGVTEEERGIKGLILNLVGDASIATQRFLHDESFGARLVSAAERQAFEGDSRFEFVELGPDESTMFFWLNQNPASTVDPAKLAIFQDVAFRRAIAHAIDREAVVKSAFLGHASPLYGPVSGAFSWARPADIDLAALTPELLPVPAIRTLLEQVDGLEWNAQDQLFRYCDSLGRMQVFGFVLHTTPSPGDVRESAAKAVAAQLQKVGITVHVEVQDFNSVVRRIDESFDYEACLMFLESSGHPSAMRGIFHSSSGMHFHRPYQEKPATEWERLVDEAFERYVETGVEAEFASVLRLWTENQPVFYLATQDKTMVMRKSWTIDDHGRTGRCRDPLLDRPIVENLRISKD